MAGDLPVGTGRVLNIWDLISNIGGPDQLGRAISMKFQSWMIYREKWLEEKAELRDYLFGTDTSKTSNRKLPWKNSTVTPKLTQIRDNLHANYMAAMFPHREWLKWEGDTEDDETEKKRQAIQSYMKTKLQQSGFETEISKLVLDYIDYGNCFASAEWVDESTIDPVTKEIRRGYIGPRVIRISPYDIVFNPLAPSFESSPKIIRTIMTLGDLALRAKDLPKNSPEVRMFEQAMDKSINVRKEIRNLSRSDTLKSEGFQIDGFGTIQQYYDSDYVEILTFFGDIYDVQSETFYQNYVISVIDRTWVIQQKPNPNWTAHSGIYHAGWRMRPDNLYAMGPLDNLVGMQYRIDHLENLKADVFDMIALPFLKIKGFVQDFEWEPGGRGYTGDDGDIECLKPDATALNADMQIDRIMKLMEEMAGAPREAMGIRSPGEKTKFEVQTLDNAASRLFMNKARHFELTFLEKLLNYMLELSRKNMSSADIVRTLDSNIDAVIFSTVSKDDITANGILHPVGASHFAYRANLLQNIVTLSNSAVMQDEGVKVHISGKKTAKLLEELNDLERFKLFEENIRVIEQNETMRLANAMKDQTDTQSITPSGQGADTQGLPGAGPPPKAGATAGPKDQEAQWYTTRDQRQMATTLLKGDQGNG